MFDYSQLLALAAVASAVAALIGAFGALAERGLRSRKERFLQLLREERADGPCSPQAEHSERLRRELAGWLIAQNRTSNRGPHFGMVSMSVAIGVLLGDLLSENWQAPITASDVFVTVVMSIVPLGVLFSSVKVVVARQIERAHIIRAYVDGQPLPDEGDVSVWLKRSRARKTSPIPVVWIIFLSCLPATAGLIAAGVWLGPQVGVSAWIDVVRTAIDPFAVPMLILAAAAVPPMIAGIWLTHPPRPNGTTAPLKRHGRGESPRKSGN